VEAFVNQTAAVETADEVRVNRLPWTAPSVCSGRPSTRPGGPITLGPEDIVEGDEAHLTAGLKGAAGHQPLEREPRRRGLKRRGRGTWESDRVPVLGLLCRGGESLP